MVAVARSATASTSARTGMRSADSSLIFSWAKGSGGTTRWWTSAASLRGGVRLIPYLRRGRYLGIDKRADLIAAGVTHELSRWLRWRKHPELVVSDRFEFDRFSRHADVGIAQSLFTHLTPEVIEQCLRSLAAWSPRCRLFATFFEADTSQANPGEPHDHRRFAYTRDEMGELAQRAGWRFTYVGEWGHPRGQMMGEFTVPR